MACREIKSPITGKMVKSKLWDQLFDLVGNEGKADELYLQTISPEFIELNGSWMNNSFTGQLNELGEPTIESLNKVTMPVSNEIYFQLDPTDEAEYRSQLNINTPLEQRKSVEKLLHAQTKVIGQKEDNYAIKEGTNESLYTRVSNYMKDYDDKFKFTGDSDAYKRNRDWGNIVDLILSNVITNRSLNDTLEDVKNMKREDLSANFTKEKIEEIYNHFQNYKNEFKGSILLTQIVLWNANKGIAGTADIVRVRPNGVVDIIDLKTSINPTNYNPVTDTFEDYQKNGYANNYKKAFNSNSASTYQKHQFQQTMYKGFLDYMGFKSGTIGIKPIHITGISGNTVTDFVIEEPYELIPDNEVLSIASSDGQSNSLIINVKTDRFRELTDKILKILDNKRKLAISRNNKKAANSIDWQIKQFQKEKEFADKIVTFLNNAHENFLGNNNWRGYLDILNDYEDKVKKSTIKDENIDYYLEKIHNIKEEINLYYDNQIFKDLFAMKREAERENNLGENSIFTKIDELKNAMESSKDIIDEITPDLLAEKLAPFISNNANKELTDWAINKNKRRLKYHNAGKKKSSQRIKKELESAGFKVEGDLVKIEPLTKKSLKNMIKRGDYKDLSLIDTHVAPAISSSNPIVALYAKQLKNKYSAARVKSIKAKRKMYRAYTAFTGDKSMDNVAKGFKGIYEKVKYGGNDRMKLIAPIDYANYTQNTIDFFEELKNRRLSKKEKALAIQEYYSENAQARPLKDITLNGQVIIKGRETIVEEKRNYMSAKQFDAWLDENTFKKDNRIIYMRELSMPKLSKYKNSNFTAIVGEEMTSFDKLQEVLDKKGSKKLEFWKASIEFYFESQNRLPNRREKNKYILPSISKSSNDRIRENGIKDYLNYTKNDSIFSLTEDEDTFGVQSELKTIPILYSFNMNANDVSLDIPLSLIKFNDASLEYEINSSMAAQSELLLEQVNKNSPNKTDSFGRQVIDAAAKKFGIKTYSQYQKDHNNNNVAVLLNGFIDANIYGKRKIRSYIPGTTIELNKLAASLMSFASKTQIAFSPLLSVSNSLTAEIQIAVEAVANQFFNKTEWKEAQEEYMKNEMEFLKDQYTRRLPESKLSLLAEMYDALQGEYKTKAGRNITRSTKKRLQSWDVPFAGQAKGEHRAQLISLIALLKNKKIKTISGEEISLYDAYEVKDKELILKDGVTVDILDINVQNKLHAISKRMHGVYNNFDAALLERYWMGNLILMYRKFVVPGFKRRFKSIGEDQELGFITQGYYNTTWKLLINEANELKNLLNPFNKEASDLTPMEEANVKRTITEILTVVMLGIIVALLKGLMEGADEEEKKLYAYPLYIALRLQTEIQFYGAPGDINQGPIGFFLPNPKDTFRLFKTPTVSTTIVDKVIRLVTQLGDPTETYDRNAGFFEKGDSKLYARILKLFGISGNNYDPEQAIKILQLNTN